LTQTSPNPAPASPAWRARRVPANLRADAAAALVGPEAGEPLAAGRRFVQAAPSFGIDLNLMFATMDPGRRPVIGHVALGVVGAGRTAMMFVSSGHRVSDDQAERVAAVESLCTALEGLGRVRIAQALPEPGEVGLVRSLVSAGFRVLGDLAYMRRPLSRADRDAEAPDLPRGLVLRQVISIERGDADRALLASALERSYEDTLDCPELCGLRRIEDVIDSHKATGEWRSDLWWLVLAGDRAEGCVLLNHCPEQGSVELVYLGLSSSIRGRGVGRAVMERAIPRAARIGASSITCAVDRRNAPAIALYQRLGFREFSSRTALVRAFDDAPPDAGAIPT